MRTHKFTTASNYMEADGTPMEIIIEQARAAIAKAEGGAQ